MLLIFATSLCATVVRAEPSFAQSDLATRPKRPLLAVVSMDKLSLATRELANDIEISPLLAELYDSERVLTPERVRDLRVKVRETITECYFDASSVQAEARREQVNLQAKLDAAQAKVNRAVNYNNAFNFLTAGSLNIVGASINFSPTVSPFPVTLMGLLSGAVSTTMSMYALKQVRGGKMHGQNQPNVLSELFGRPNDSKTTYPESVWRFLHEKSPRAATPMTRAQLLEQEWIDKGYLLKHGSRHAQAKLDFVCGVETEKKIATMSDLSDEINMLGDIEALAGLMHHHLRDLLALVDTDVLDEHRGTH